MTGGPRLTSEAVAPYLIRLRLGRRFHVFDEVTSTQDEAKRIVDEAPHGTLVLAESQTRGRGRSGAAWLSAPGLGLWLSLILKPGRPPVDWPILSPLAGLALVQTVWDLYGMTANIKWPNDVWVTGRKLCGILAESQPAAGWVILGMGINVHHGPEHFPQALRGRAISLSHALGVEVPSRPILLAQLLRRLGEIEGEFAADGPGVFRERLRRAELTMGRRVRIRTGGGVVEGVASDLGARGELVLRLPGGGVREVRSGHVELVTPSETA